MATYDELLDFDSKLKTHQKYLQFLAIEIYKSKNELNPQVSCEKHIRRKISHIHWEGVFPSQFQMYTLRNMEYIRNNVNFYKSLSYF